MNFAVIEEVLNLVKKRENTTYGTSHDHFRSTWIMLKYHVSAERGHSLHQGKVDMLYQKPRSSLSPSL